MKTATVRDLRNRYTNLLDWIGAGEEIVITRNGKPFARLIPEQAETGGPINWSSSPAVKRDRSKSHTLSASESKSILQESSGQW